jgi:hypothetical protein
MEREVSYGSSGFALQFMLDTSLSDQDRYPLKLRDLLVTSWGDKAPEDLVWSASPEFVIRDVDNVGFSGDRYHRPAYMSKEWAPLEGSVMFVDPSGRGGDETAFAVAQMRNGFIFVPVVRGGKAGMKMP